MLFNKAMIDLVREIRRRVPTEEKPGIKLANPELLYELSRWYKDGADIVSKALIKELFHIAGDPWPKTLEEEQKEEGPRYVTKVYRGQTRLEPTKEEQDEADKPKRIYRGQIIS